MSQPQPPDHDRARPADHAVLDYLAAIEGRRAIADTLPHPDKAGPDLASAEMVHGEELGEGLAAFTPGSQQHIARLEEAFVAEAAEYGRRHGIGYRGWLESGVDSAVLERAGISPDDH